MLSDGGQIRQESFAGATLQPVALRYSVQVILITVVDEQSRLGEFLAAKLASHLSELFAFVNEKNVSPKD